MTELEKNQEDRLLHDDLEGYTDLFIVKKDKITAKFEDDMAKLKAKVDSTKTYKEDAGKDFDEF